MLELYINIKQRRIELGMTQTELATKVGYADKSIISRIEKGLVDIPLSKIIEIAKALDISACDIMGNDGIEEELQEPSFTPHETTLLDSFRQLNDDGQEKVLDYIEDLLDSPKYKRGQISDVSQGAG